MENFPWTRLPGVALPEGRKPMDDPARLAMLNPQQVREYVGDGVVAYLHRAGHPVVLVDAAADHVARIRERRLRIEGLIDAAFLCVRAYHAVGASRHIANSSDCDAVICVDEDIALGALFECKRRGIDVPTDFGMCGFSDLGFSSVRAPSITTITTPLYEIGKSASELLRTYSDDKKSEVVDLGFLLSVRESTRRPLQRNRNTAIDEERMAVDKT